MNDPTGGFLRSAAFESMTLTMARTINASKMKSRTGAPVVMR
jgi:hypothetical protein